MPPAAEQLINMFKESCWWYLWAVHHGLILVLFGRISWCHKGCWSFIIMFLLGCRKCLTSWISKLSLPKGINKHSTKVALDWRLNNILFCSKLAMTHYCYSKWTWSCIQQHVVYLEWAQAKSRRFWCPKPRINFAIFLSIKNCYLMMVKLGVPHFAKYKLGVPHFAK
jgi:hypothetical protein